MPLHQFGSETKEVEKEMHSDDLNNWDKFHQIESSDLDTLKNHELVPEVSKVDNVIIVPEVAEVLEVANNQL